MKCVRIWQTSSCVFIVNFKHILHLVLAFQLLTMINNEQVLDSWGGGGSLREKCPNTELILVRNFLYSVRNIPVSQIFNQKVLEKE